MLLLFNANSAIFQLYYGEDKLIFNEICIKYVDGSTSGFYFDGDDDEVRFVLGQHADFHSASSLKQLSAGRPVGPLGHIIQIQRKPVFALSP